MRKHPPKPASSFIPPLATPPTYFASPLTLNIPPPAPNGPPTVPLSPPSPYVPVTEPISPPAADPTCPPPVADLRATADGLACPQALSSAELSGSQRRFQAPSPLQITMSSCTTNSSSSDMEKRWEDLVVQSWKYYVHAQNRLNELRETLGKPSVGGAYLLAERSGEIQGE